MSREVVKAKGPKPKDSVKTKTPTWPGRDAENAATRGEETLSAAAMSVLPAPKDYKHTQRMWENPS